MLLLDVNVLVYAHRPEMAAHEPMSNWLTQLAQGSKAFGIPELVLSGFIRVVTRGKPFLPPTPTNIAFDFCDQLLKSPSCMLVRPSETHWQVFAGLCRAIGARSNAVPDAYYAAMAIDQQCEWVTFDQGFRKFPGLTWRHPLEDRSITNPA